MTPDPAVKSEAKRLLALSNADLHLLVAEDLQGKLTPLTRAALRSPEVIDVFYTSVADEKRNIESQLASRASDWRAQANIGKHEATPEFRKRKSNYERWRGGALRYKDRLEALLADLRLDRARQAPTIDAALRNLEAQVVAHYEASIGTRPPTVDDIALWSSVATLMTRLEARLMRTGQRDGSSDGGS